MSGVDDFNFALEAFGRYYGMVKFPYPDRGCKGILCFWGKTKKVRIARNFRMLAT
jgi:hypothetical protein